MFEAIRLHDRLQSEKRPEEIFEVATISGSDLGGVSADRKVVSELNNLLDSFSANEVIWFQTDTRTKRFYPLSNPEFRFHQSDA